jgi:hypothetical protein
MMLAVLQRMWPDFIQALGGGLGVVGSFYLANRHLNVPFWQMPRYLLFAFFNRNRVAERISEWSEENALKSLKGLALIALGFLLQIVPTIVYLICAAIS